MAKTKKHEKIAEEKQEIAGKILQINEAIKAACSKVPEKIINAPYEITIQWRELAKKHHYEEFKGRKHNTLNDLKGLLAIRQNILKTLQGE